MRAAYATSPSAAEIPPGAMWPDLDIHVRDNLGKAAKKGKVSEGTR